jgi:hypothetical protein
MKPGTVFPTPDQGRTTKSSQLRLGLTFSHGAANRVSTSSSEIIGFQPHPCMILAPAWLTRKATLLGREIYVVFPSRPSLLRFGEILRLNLNRSALPQTRQRVLLSCQFVIGHTVLLGNTPELLTDLDYIGISQSGK